MVFLGKKNRTLKSERILPKPKFEHPHAVFRIMAFVVVSHGSRSATPPLLRLYLDRMECQLDPTIVVAEESDT